jgi:hypothetical protein
MRTWAIGLLASVAVSALVLAWGYWYSLNHASLQLRVDDYALKSERQASGVPHGVILTFRDSAKVELAVARSVEPLGYILAVHPSADIGNCEHRGIRPSSGGGSQGDYSARYAQYSAWSATWAPRVHSADVSVGSCRFVRPPSPSTCPTTNGGSGGSRSATLAGSPGNTSSSLSPLTAARARPLQPLETMSDGHAFAHRRLARRARYTGCRP